MTIQTSFSSIGLKYFQRIEFFGESFLRAGLYHSLSLYRNRPIWAVAVGGDFALSQEGLTKKVQFFGNYLVQCMKKNSEWSKLFEPFFSFQCQFGHGVTRIIRQQSKVCLSQSSVSRRL